MSLLNNILYHFLNLISIFQRFKQPNPFQEILKNPAACEALPQAEPTGNALTVSVRERGDPAMLLTGLMMLVAA
jgi:hypothetical protein